MKQKDMSNEKGRKRTIQRVNETKSGFSETTNKIDKVLSKLTKRHRPNIKIYENQTLKGP